MGKDKSFTRKLVERTAKATIGAALLSTGDPVGIVAGLALGGSAIIDAAGDSGKKLGEYKEQKEK